MMAPCNFWDSANAYIGATALEVAAGQQNLMRGEAIRARVEAVARELYPVRILMFGSLASGLALASSDIDLCVFQDKETVESKQLKAGNQCFRVESQLKPKLSPLSESTINSPVCANPPIDPAAFAAVLRRHGFTVLVLLRTRIPILRLSLPSLPPADLGLFENKLALHNTDLLHAYSCLDSRVRPIVLFVKHWARCRSINETYRSKGLSSYGFVLLILFYLINCTLPPLLPNLQLIPPPEGIPIPQSALTCNGHDVWFYRDWPSLHFVSKNTQSIAELLASFFRFFGHSFDFRDQCIAIRLQGGIISKADKGWTHAIQHQGFYNSTVKDRYILAIEDPFEITHNVGRTVTQSALYELRGEFMRAARIFSTQNVEQLLNELCAKRTIS